MPTTEKGACVGVYVYIYIYRGAEREREKEGDLNTCQYHFEVYVRYMILQHH